MIVNVIMPTFNDEQTIVETLNSIIHQSYVNWHLYIINDGSTDNSEKVIKEFIKIHSLEAKITYVYQKNSDQLNAIKSGLSMISDNDGIVYICHSDDLINDDNVFEKAVDYFINNNVDAIISDINIINKDSMFIKCQKVKKYKKSLNTIALQGLWLGRNLFVDVAFFRYRVFKANVYENYLTWNGPFWLNQYDKLSMLNVAKVNFPFMKYRVFEDNYINNEIGILNVLNGEVRTAMNILSNIHIVAYRLQYILFRLFNKFNMPYKVWYKNGICKKPENIVSFIISKRIPLKDISKYPYFDAIIAFFKNYNKVDNAVILKDLNDEDVFLGSDMRKFNKLMLNGGGLPFIYNYIFEQMKSGFKKVETTKKDLKNVENLLKFLDIYKYVDIIVK